MRSINGGKKFPARSQNSQVPGVPEIGLRIAVHKAQISIHIMMIRRGFMRSRIAIMMSKAPMIGISFQAISSGMP
jgi:hypothetical protein